MKATYPNNLPMPIAEDGIRNTIPEITPYGTGALSFTSGFPDVTSKPLSAGGIAPAREDFNGALHTLSKWIFYLQAGGQIEYSDTIDYSVGARVFYENIQYLCIKENGKGTINGVQAVSNAKYWEIIALPSLYSIGQFVQLYEPTPPEGFLQCNGALITNASEVLPELYSVLQTSEKAWLLKTEEEWQAMSTAIYYTNSSNVKYTWDGIGGVPYFVLDTIANTIRMPDTRGMYRENSGFDELEVGGVHHDMQRNISGYFYNSIGDGSDSALGANVFGGAFYGGSTVMASYGHDTLANRKIVSLASSRTVPTGNFNKPRAYGVLECVYVGTIKSNTGE